MRNYEGAAYSRQHGLHLEKDAPAGSLAATSADVAAAPAPSVDCLDDAVFTRCRQMFDRALAQWAMDVLVLRKAGLHRISWIETSPAIPDDFELIFD
jgi:hypothetical protein